MRTNTKIALLFFVSNVLVMLLFAGAIYYFLNEYSYVDFYKRLQTRATVAASYTFGTDKLSAVAVRKLREQHLERLPDEREYVIEVADDNFGALAAKYELPESFLQDIWQNNKATLKQGETFYTGINYNAAGRQYIIIVSADNYYSSHHLRFIRNVMLWGMLFIGVLTVLLSLYVSRHIFDPIKRITDDVKQVSTYNIHQRLPNTENNTEISELVSTFNDLLNRIETALETQKNFISNASHELGTPLTAIMGEAEVALMKERQPAEYKESLEKIAKQAGRLDQITRSLLFLAQTAYKGKKINIEPVRADELIWEVKETIDKLNPGNQILIDSSLFPEDPQKLRIQANKQLLHLALANILSNACKYSHNKPVSVSIAAADSQVIIIVKDEGVGIPEAEIQFIYDPFFRASNTHFFEGYGIGLPLSRNIIRLHNGQLLVSSVVNKGTTVQIKLPQAAPEF